MNAYEAYLYLQLHLNSIALDKGDVEERALVSICLLAFMVVREPVHMDAGSEDENAQVGASDDHVQDQRNNAVRGAMHQFNNRRLSRDKGEPHRPKSKIMIFK